MVLGLSLLLIGSCNESADVFDFSKKPVVLTQLDKSDLIRYAYKVQAALTYRPENLKNLRRGDLKLALAQPDLNRRDGGKAIWQYRNESCVLDVYWQQPKESSKIVHYEFRMRRSIFDKVDAASDPAAWQCLQSLINERQEIVRREFEETYAVLSLKAHKS